MKDATPVIDAMRTVVLWREMQDTCESRGRSIDTCKCYGCPYYKSIACTKIPTSVVLRHIADIFDEYLTDEEVV